jgi:hypothetical protein
MKPPIAVPYQYALKNEQTHPAEHGKAMNDNQRNNLPCHISSEEGFAVQDEITKPDYGNDQHDACSDHVEGTLCGDGTISHLPRLQGSRHTRCNFCHETPPRAWTIPISLKAISNLRLDSEVFYRFDFKPAFGDSQAILDCFVGPADYQNPDHDQSVSSGSIAIVKIRHFRLQLRH